MNVNCFPDDTKVVKFGGSSLADAQHFTQVRDIIRADETRRYVIPSAPGKRFSGDPKVTDMLYDSHPQEGTSTRFFPRSSLDTKTSWRDSAWIWI